jgi:hypothetical protein
MAFTEDMGVFFVPGDPGVVSATIGTTSGIVGDFHDEYVEEFGIEGDAPTLTVPDSSLPIVHGHGTAVTIGATSYTIVGVKPDGTGITLLVLELVG